MHLLLCNLVVIYFVLPPILVSVFILKITNKLKHKNKLILWVHELTRDRHRARARPTAQI
jgi:hypothetical protein